MVDAPRTVYNFSAGPCCLPKPVLAEAAADMIDYKGTGMSVMEMSHRGKTFTTIAEKCRSDVKRLLAIPDNFTIFMFQGGASLQFSAICYNLLQDGEKQTANFVTTGTWSEGAIVEAKKYCNANEVTNNKSTGYTTVAAHDNWNIAADAKFFHYCDNETIQGVEFNDFPFDKVPEGQVLVCDMSSNFMTRPVDWSKYGVVYAGAQKNVGPAGVTFVIVRNDLIVGHRSDTPLLCDWESFSKAANTFFNTPSCWPIYICGLNCAYMIEQGGIEAMQAKCLERSTLLYNYIDSSEGYYVNNVESKFRSRTNIPFRVCANDDLEKKFIAESAAANLTDLAGHRSVGGCRASIYNAMPVEGVHALIAFMTTFKENNPRP